MNIIIYPNAVITGYQVAKTHLYDPILSLSLLFALCMYFNVKTDTENGGNITFQLHFPLENEKNCRQLSRASTS